MIERIDRLQIVVADRAAAAATYARILGAEVAREDKSEYLAARRTVMALGESEIELLEPDGTGRAATALAERGEGLFAGGVATRDPEQLDARLRGLGLTPTREGEQMHLEGSPGFGARFVVSPLVARPRVGPVSFLYEVTITLIGDWRAAAAWYTAIFALDPRRFSPIESGRFGYRGTLTLVRSSVAARSHRAVAGDRLEERDGPLGGAARRLALHGLRRDPRSRGVDRAPRRRRRALDAARTVTGRRARRPVGPSVGAPRPPARRVADDAGVGVVGPAGAGHARRIVSPPSTCSVTPVQNDAAGKHSDNVICATSSGSP